jgi:rhamnosyltransferase
MGNKIVAILVLYYPNLLHLSLALNKLSKQVSQLILVNNGAPNNEIEKLGESYSAHYIQNVSNLGIAAAQNLGIKWAMQRDFSHILTMDQDSLAHESMVKNLLDSEEKQLTLGEKVGAVGSVDSRFLKHLKNERLVSSGMLVKTKVFLDVGLMNEKLFIDGVDDDWCFRAKAKGYKLFHVKDAKIQHEIGEVQKIWHKFVISYHQPSRYYFFFRNYIFLIRQNYVPLKYKLQLVKTLCKELIKIIFLPKKWLYVKNSTKGLISGITYE